MLCFHNNILLVLIDSQMPKRRLIEATVREELKFGWEVLNEENTNCASLSVIKTHKHFWVAIFLPLMRKEMFLNLNEGENWERKVLVIKRQKEEA